MAMIRKHIHRATDRRWPVSKIPEGDSGVEEAFAADWTRECENCDATPVVNATGLCGPCTFGDADTESGSW